MGTLTRGVSLLVLGWPVVALAVPEPVTPSEMVELARTAVGYSFWAGNGCWRVDQEALAQPGDCVGLCPACEHHGSLGADASGLVSKVWQVPGPAPVHTCAHPFTSMHFMQESTWWSHPDRSGLQPGDVLGWHADGRGHLVLVEGVDEWGSLWTVEARNCAFGIVHNLRVVPSVFRAVRRDYVEPDCTPTPEVCNGRDDDCNAQVDEGDACTARDALQAWVADGTGSSDINGDGRADACVLAQGDTAVHCYLAPHFTRVVQGPTVVTDSAVERGALMRMGDLDGDHKADLCVVLRRGLTCWLSTGSGFGSPVELTWVDTEDGDNGGVLRSSVRFADITGDGQQDVCALSTSGLTCWPFTGNGFGIRVSAPPWTREEGWDAPHHVGTLRTGDLNGDAKADVCIRWSAGMSCWLSNGQGFTPPLPGPAWSDARGFSDARLWSTIRLVDINGDGMSELCARTEADFRCHRFEDHGFGPPIPGPTFSGASGDGLELGMADLNADGLADLCARDGTVIRCWTSTGHGFAPAEDAPEPSPQPTDAPALRLADINGDGRAEPCMVGSAGMQCGRSTGHSRSPRVEWTGRSTADGGSVPETATWWWLEGTRPTQDGPEAVNEQETPVQEQAKPGNDAPEVAEDWSHVLPGEERDEGKEITLEAHRSPTIHGQHVAVPAPASHCGMASTPADGKVLVILAAWWWVNRRKHVHRRS